MSLILANFSAAYSIQLAVQYPLLVPFVCVVAGLFLKHHMLGSLGAIGGVVMGGAVAHYYDWEPYDTESTILTIACAIGLTLVPVTWTVWYRTLAFLLSFGLDYILLKKPSMAYVKNAYLACIMSVHMFVKFALPQFSALDQVDQMKLEFIVFSVYALGLAFLLDRLKKKKE